MWPIAKYMARSEHYPDDSYQLNVQLLNYNTNLNLRAQISTCKAFYSVNKLGTAKREEICIAASQIAAKILMC